jgi:uncharacterized protein YeaO (DUF488 family)
MKDIAPSDELRKWFDHDPEKFDEFSKKYREELNDKKQILKEMHNIAKEHRVSLLYAAKDEEYNQVVVLKDVLEKE